MISLGIIPARGGSKGVPGKNLKRLGDKTLLGHAIASAKQSSLLTRFVVSTEDDAIAVAAREEGGDVPFKRPSEFATDQSGMVPVLQHAVRWFAEHENFKPDCIVLLQPVTPFRTGKHIDLTIQKLIDTGADSVLTIREPDYSPFFMKTMVGDRVQALFPEESRKYVCRQDAPVVYRPTGAVYATRTSVLMNENRILGADTRGIVMSFEESINIDTIWDFKMAEVLISGKVVSSTSR